MKDKELRKLIGSRAKQRRLELGLKQPYVAVLPCYRLACVILYLSSSYASFFGMVLL